MKKSKEAKVKGEVTVISYKKGEALPGFTPLDEGTYSFTLKNAGKPFPKGWKVKPGKFPNKRVTWEALDTEDDKGGNKTVGETISLSPGSLPIGPIRLAYAAQFDITLKQGPKKKPNHVSVRENAKAIDEMLQFIKKEELTLRGDVTHEDWNGQKMARIRWLPPEDLDDTESDEDEEVEEDEDDEAPETDDDEEESDDEEADEDEESDDEGDDDSDSDDEDEDGDDDDDSDGDDDDDDTADEDDEEDAEVEEDDDEELSDEAVAEHTKRQKKGVKPGAKVKQGPSGKGGKKPAAKKAPKKGKKK